MDTISFDQWKQLKMIDLTHVFGKNMPVYPGEELPELIQTANIEKNGYNDFCIKTGMHVGTHMDAPFHMLKNGKKLAQYPVDHFIGKGHLIDARGQKSIGADLLAKRNIKEKDIVIVMTGFYKKFKKPQYYKDYPEIEESFARKLIDLKVKILGLDTPSPDRAPFKIHKLLLGHEILIIENLTNLEKLIGEKDFDIIALPVKFDAEAAPVRVLAGIN